jgi:mitochondrial enoyl-[acyl-carrier protein] reductase / trans-2-enoyl-CoA reductase
MRAIQLQFFGKPADAVKLVDVPDVGAPGPDEVVIAVEASPINGTDHLIIGGRYGYLPPLPSILGVEGVGRVAAIGRNVKHLKEGDRTLTPLMHPAWAERIKTSAPWLRPLPNADIQQLSMLGINPATAYLLLTDIVPLKRGDWVIQNGANSAVGRAVIAIAKTLGIKTVNVVRREELVDEIKSLGGDVVLVEGPELPKLVAAATGKALISLAIDMVADTATMNLMNSIAPNGTVVLYSVSSQKPLVGSGIQLIFNNQSIRGFWLINWFKTATPDKLAAMYDHLASMIASGAISAPIAASYPFEKFPDALALAAKRGGKVIFTPQQIP